MSMVERSRSRVRRRLRMSLTRWSCTSPSLFVEDVLNPIIGLEALHQNSVQFHLFQTGKAYLQQKSHKAVLHYLIHKNHYYASGLVSVHHIRPSINEFSTQVRRSTSKINSEARLTQSQEEEEDVSLESQKASVSENPRMSHSSRKRSSLVDSLALQVMVHCMSACQGSASASQRESKAHKCHSTRS